MLNAERGEIAKHSLAKSRKRAAFGKDVGFLARGFAAVLRATVLLTSIGVFVLRVDGAIYSLMGTRRNIRLGINLTSSECV